MKAFLAAVGVAVIAVSSPDGRAQVLAHEMERCKAGTHRSGGACAGQVDIGSGRKLYLECRGTGKPTVLLESGYHDSSDPWRLSDSQKPVAPRAVLPGVARFTRVCTYDRPGTIRYTERPALTDRSTPVSMPRTAQDVVKDLHLLLAAAGVPGPYVMVGHSLGGLFLRLYAQTYPEDVRALVLVDAFAAEIPALFGSQWPAYRQLLDTPLPEFANDPSFERIDVDASVAQIQSAPGLRALPVAVLTKTEPFPLPPDTPGFTSADLERAWSEGAKAMVGLAPQTPQIFASGSGHYIQVQQPDLVIQALALVIARARQGK
jgi:pimeloyl-ACP methyl ester carboxylesterase